MLPKLDIPGFRFSEKKYTRLESGRHVRRFQLEEWCPLAQKYYPVLSTGRWYFVAESADATPVRDDQIVFSDRLLNAIRNRPKEIAVFREDNGNRYFDACTTEDIGRACVSVLKQRKQEGWFTKPGPEPVPPSRKPEDFEDDKELQKAVTRQWANYTVNLRDWKEEVSDWEDLQEAVNTDNYYVAFTLCQSRSGYEYEGFSLERLEEPC